MDFIDEIDLERRREVTGGRRVTFLCITSGFETKAGRPVSAQRDINIFIVDVLHTIENIVLVL